MCHANVDAKLLEREAMERLRATQPRPRVEETAEAGPPPELMGGLAGVTARLSRALRPVLARRRPARG